MTLTLTATKDRNDCARYDAKLVVVKDGKKKAYTVGRIGVTEINRIAEEISSEYNGHKVNIVRN